MGINLASYVGATQVRRMVLGDADVQPTPAQLEQMKALVRRGDARGAVGVSTALQYAPAPYAKTEEIDCAAPRKHRSSAASTRRTCAAKATPCSQPLTKRFASAAKRIFQWRSGISKSAGKANWGHMPRDRRADRCGRRRRRRHHAPTPTPTPLGSTPCRLSFRHGRTTEATPN